MELLDLEFLDNSMLNWLIAAGVGISSFLAMRLIQGLAGRRISALAARTDTYWDDILAEIILRTKGLFLLLAAIHIASLLLILPDRTVSVITKLFYIALFIQCGIWGSAVASTLLKSYHSRALKNNTGAISTINVIGIISKIALWSTVVLLALDNLGVNITALVTGLGIGGVAVALAVQNVLGDLLASLSITLDKPFVIGDFLIIGDFMGSVEYIGLKTTRIRSLSGEQLVFSNSDLLKSRIRNYGRMFERRVVFHLGVTYDTPREKLRIIPAIIREAVSAQDKTRFDRAHFMKYGDYALQFETVYYILTPDYNTYMDIQQAIYLMIHERFEQEGIEFAYPTQKLFVAQEK